MFFRRPVADVMKNVPIRRCDGESLDDVGLAPRPDALVAAQGRVQVERVDRGHVKQPSFESGVAGAHRYFCDDFAAGRL